ncbi:MAG TPA: diguanylate cyclase [Patescibacteria group bacterium]|nr:diguanylate cyclase [Patescibacteria group bacterium]
MLEIKEEIKSGSILIDAGGEVLYSSFTCRYETNRFLEEIGALNKIRNGVFGEEKHGNYWVVLQEIIDKKHLVYLIAYKEIFNESNLLHLAFKDIMSGLYNRNMWEYLLSIGYRDLSYTFDTLVIVDIDNLKEVNDAEGHSSGDRCIRAVAESIKDSIREKDIAFRYGGDEFVIMLYDFKGADMNEFINRLRMKIIKRSDNSVVSISIGVSYFEKYEELGMAFQLADKNLYAEKEKKKVKDKYSNYNNMPELKTIINKTREMLYKLIAQEESHQNEEVLELSRKLDILIHYYITLEMNMNH